MSKTYTKTHKSEQIAKNHAKNIKKRDGSASVKIEGKKVTYKFKD